MKKNWMQLLSLLLSVVLLVLLFKQNQTIKDLQSSLQNVENRMYDLEDEVRGISGDVTRAVEEAANPIQNWEVQPKGIDKENQRLLADVALELKSWQEDTVVHLETVVGADQHILALPVNSVGTCSGVMQFPVNEQCEVTLAAVVTSGGVTTRTDLGGWGDISMLLPVQMHSWGGSVPTYQDGKLLIGQYEGSLEDPNGQAIAGINTRYRLYVNDALVREEAECVNWEQACATGDQVKLTLACEDEFGLGYEFLLYAGKCEESGELNEAAAEAGSGGSVPVLNWPE